MDSDESELFNGLREKYRQMLNGEKVNELIAILYYKEADGEVIKGENILFGFKPAAERNDLHIDIYEYSTDEETGADSVELIENYAMAIDEEIAMRLKYVLNLILKNTGQEQLPWEDPENDDPLYS